MSAVVAVSHLVPPSTPVAVDGHVFDGHVFVGEVFV